MCRLFKHKTQIHSGEMVMTHQQMMAYQAAKDIRKNLDDLEAEERIVTEDEVREAVAKAISMKFERMKTNFNKPHTCSQCGAPIHNGKCDYCGTIYN